jgi:putative N6-adenine-specific DNA methylase
MHFLIKTLSGLEPILQRELIRSGAQNIKPVTRGFTCSADLAWMYKANYTLRTAMRILVPIEEFEAVNDQQLYDGIRNIQWKEYMTVRQTFAVDAVCRSEYFTHSQYAGLKTKDAIVDQWREEAGRRPDVDTTAPDLLVHVHIIGSNITVLLDSSGSSLHRRGYRKDQVEAPLNEALAAGMIQMTGWQGESTFFDPMCGSGTLPIEAAMRALKMPAQYFRPSLGFQRWFDFDKKLWQTIKGNADAEILKQLDFEIIGTDRDPRARNCSATNLMSAPGLEKFVRFEKAEFATVKVPEPAGVMIFNPPYDERMREDDIIATYRGFGDIMKQRFDGWQAWIISSNRDAIKNIGLRPESRTTVYNGPLECSYQKFNLWKKLTPIVAETAPETVPEA